MEVVIIIKELSVLPGRIRLKHEGLYQNKPLCRYVHVYVEGLFGVNFVEANACTGTMLILFDPARVDLASLKENIKTAIASHNQGKQRDVTVKSQYLETLEERDKARKKFLFFGLLYLVLKLKHSIYGKFTLSRNVKILQVASAVTIVGGYPLLKRIYRRFTKKIPTDSDLLLKLMAASFTIMRESSKGVLVLVLKYLNEYIKLSAETACQRTLYKGMQQNAGMVWMIDKHGQEVLVSLEVIKTGDIIYIHQGDVIPTECEVVEGKGVVNNLTYTGQPVAAEISVGSRIFEGMSVISGNLIARVIRLPECANKQDISLEKLNINSKLKKFQDTIVPIAIGAGMLSYVVTRSMLNALSVMLVLTPSAAGVALSAGMKNYISLLKRHHIYIRNPNTFEKIISAGQIVFDKTGTLTYGNMGIHSVEVFNKAYTREQLLQLCAACETGNSHPIAVTLQNQIHWQDSARKLQSSVLLPSRGVEAVYNNHHVLLGNSKLFNEKNIEVKAGVEKYISYEKEMLTPVFVAVDKVLCGIIVFEDVLRHNALELIEKLRANKIDNIVLLSGDSEEKTVAIARKLGISKAYSEYSAEEKLQFIAQSKLHHVVMMIGDGINDKEAMKEADVSISFANGACDGVKLHSDCIIFDEDISKLSDLIILSQKAYKKITRNILFAQGYNTLFGLLAFFQHFDTFTAKSLNTINSLMILLLNERIRWTLPERRVSYLKCLASEYQEKKLSAIKSPIEQF